MKAYRVYFSNKDGTWLAAFYRTISDVKVYRPQQKSIDRLMKVAASGQYPIELECWLGKLDVMIARGEA